MDRDTPSALIAADPNLWQHITQAGRDALLLVRLWVGSMTGNEVGEQTTWLHSNHLGAPELATDRQGQVIWQARYSPFGAAQVEAKTGQGTAFVLHLRLPGQVFDPETGLHYNRARYYDPQAGQYLTPDPLGHPDGPNPYAYVAFNPLVFIDPDGLILFAFDGTGNSDDLRDPAMEGSDFTNVVRFRDAYDEGVNGRRHYITGVGTVHRDQQYGNIVPDDYAKNSRIDWITPRTPLFYNDMGGNYSGPARIDRMMLYLRDEAIAFDDKKVMEIDIIGFSRGAAQAREFANRITRESYTINGKTFYKYKDRQGKDTCQWVNFRFMGLWDSVLSVNYSGTGYSLNIPNQFKHVAHAVALNEYRSDTLENWSSRNPLKFRNHYGGFPLESIGASSSSAGRVRIERGFLGAHADIGGGYGPGENQLALVALDWMVAQAEIAGVKMNNVQNLPTGRVVLHDQSNAMNLGDPRTTQNLGSRPPFTVIRAEDRTIRGAVSGNTQRTMGFGPAALGGNRSMVNADTHKFISYRPRDVNKLGTGSALDSSTMGNNTGTVDMEGYLNWLRHNGYVFTRDY